VWQSLHSLEAKRNLVTVRLRLRVGTLTPVADSELAVTVA
jgi:hypothetical protein